MSPTPAAPAGLNQPRSTNQPTARASRRATQLPTALLPPPGLQEESVAVQAGAHTSHNMAEVRRPPAGGGRRVGLLGTVAATASCVLRVPL